MRSYERELVVAAVVLAVCSLAVGAQAPSAAGAKVVTVIKAGLLLDPQRGVVERNQTILVDDGKVPGAPVIDLTKYTVLPA